MQKFSAFAKKHRRENTLSALTTGAQIDLQKYVEPVVNRQPVYRWDTL